MHRHLSLALVLVSACSPSPFVEETTVSYDLITARAVGEETLVLATLDGEPVIGRFEEGAFVVQHELSGRDVLDLWGAPDGVLFVATGDGVASFEDGEWSDRPIDAGRDVRVTQVAGLGDEVFATAWDAEDAYAPPVVLALEDGRFVPGRAPSGTLGATPTDVFVFGDEATHRRVEGRWVVVDDPPFGYPRIAGDALVAFENASVTIYRDGAWQVLPELPLRALPPAVAAGDPFEQLDEVVVLGDAVVAQVDTGEYGCWSGALFYGGGCGHLLDRLEIHHLEAGAARWTLTGDLGAGGWLANRLLAIDGDAWLTARADGRTRMGRVAAGWSD